MKNLIKIIFLMGIIFSPGIGQASLLIHGIVYTEGVVVFKNENQNQLTVKNESGVSKVFIGHAHQIHPFKVGEKVIILHNAGSDEINVIKPL